MAVILLPLHPASCILLMHKEEEAYNLWLIWKCFWWISCLCDFCGCSSGCCLTTHISFNSLVVLTIEGVYRVLESVFRVTVGFHKDQETEWNSELGLNSSGLVLMIFLKMSLRTHHNYHIYSPISWSWLLYAETLNFTDVNV